MLSKNELKYYAKMAADSFIYNPLYIAIVKKNLSENDLYITLCICVFICLTLKILS